MPRPARISVANGCYHVLNRGNGRGEVFHTDGDYAAFMKLIGDACERLKMRVLAYCMMPNHFHLVLQPHKAGDLSRWMQWLTTSHVRRYHRHYGTSGHVWQDRYKSFPIEADDHLYAVLRYVERNPLRATLVDRAQDWPWSSLRLWRLHNRPSYLTGGPMSRPADWVRRVNRADSEAELEALRKSVARSSPFGSKPWQTRSATRHALQSTLRPRGRPPKKDEK